MVFNRHRGLITTLVLIAAVIGLTMFLVAPETNL
ncbi:unnamed protein product, partial [marine sediment metagenome]